MFRRLLAACFGLVFLGITQIAGAAEETVPNATYRSQLNEGLGLWQSDQGRARELLLQAFAGAIAAKDDLIAGNAVVAVSFPALVAETSQSCLSAVGKEQAAFLVGVCALVSPATHPPCASANSCKVITDEIIRSCKLIENLGDIPDRCKPFKLIGDVRDRNGGMDTGNGANTGSPARTSSANGPDARNSGASPQKEPAPVGTVTAQDQNRDHSVLSQVIAFGMLFAVALVFAYFVKKDGFFKALWRFTKWSIAAFFIIPAVSMAATGAMPPAVPLVMIGIVLAWIGIGHLVKDVCPRCKKRVSMKISTSRYGVERREDADRWGVKWVEHYTLVTTKTCPNCGHETEKETEEKRDLGYTKKFIEER